MPMPAPHLTNRVLYAMSGKTRAHVAPISVSAVPTALTHANRLCLSWYGLRTIAINSSKPPVISFWRFRVR